MENLPPEEYKKILEGIELLNILIKNVKSNINHGLISERMPVRIKDQASYKIVEDQLIVEDKYTLIVKNNDGKNALKIECIYILFFNLQNKITDEFFQIYKEVSLPLTVWPFFRELAHSITSKMGIPPLTLPLIIR